MKIKSPIGFLALWSAFLAVGTWILPMGTLFIGSARTAQAAPISDADAESYLAAQAAIFIGMVQAGELDPAPYSVTSVDLDADGISDPILVTPSRADGGGGRVIAARGSSTSTLIDANQSPGEIGFGLRIALVGGVEAGGVKTLLVSSCERNQDAQGAHSLVIRAFSGLSGALIAVSRHSFHRGDFGSIDFEQLGRNFRLAGDLDASGGIEMSDIFSVADSMEAQVSKIEADLDCDGALTGIDVIETSLRVGVSEASGNGLIARLATVEESQVLVAGDASDWYGAPPTPEPHHWSSWECWGMAAWIAVQLALLLAEIALCAGSLAVPSPATVLCVIMALCTAAGLLASIADWAIHCAIYTNGDDGWVQPMDELLGTVQMITGICTALSGGILAWREVIERAGGIKAIIDRLLRHFGLKA
jgi:hypothetical protein